MDMEPKRLVVVLGMCRGDTCTFARGLNVIGVEFGKGMSAPVGDKNDKVCCDDVEINGLNVEIFSALGLGGRNSKAVNQSDLNFLEKNDYFSRAVEILNQKMLGIPVYGFSDPLSSKLLPFWNEIFRQCKLEVSYVIALKNPLGVAQTLGGSDGFVKEHSCMLWLDQILTSLLESAGSKRVIVDYNALTNDPDLELERLAKKLDLEVNQEQLRSFKLEFHDQPSRHNDDHLADLTVDDASHSLARKIYTQLLDIANDKTEDDAQQFLNKIPYWINEFEHFRPIMNLLDSFIEAQNTLSRSPDVRAKENESFILNVKRCLDQINLLSQDIEFHKKQNDELTAEVEISASKISKLKIELHKLNNSHQEQAAQLATILNSKSWLITKPLRFSRKNLLSAPHKILREIILGFFHMLWRLMPIPQQKKQNLVESLIGRLPQFAVDFFIDPPPPKIPSLNLNENVTYVPLLQGKPLKNKQAKLICFYLPQFHAIPENDAWWGEGFTEWTNVLPAKPLFHGHYQPHIPGELGAYNLLDKSTQKRQIELAKLYGIEGFCFYFYWFGGKRLLEAPTENYLNDPSLDLPFCLCWANENWSRRWDGLDSEILIAQQHSPEDDIAFISYLSKYLTDSRYIRIDGKPLLLVYRPQLLTSAIETVGRWRDWCRANGIGEIFLAYTQSFEFCDPKEYGFDAAIEFPPNRTPAPILTQEAVPLDDAMAATIYDWSYLVEQSAQYKQPTYELFRSVCPSWDNTARRKNNAAIFANSSPGLYQRWLNNAINNAVEHAPNPDHRLVFVNAWNEWAEGAYLEPDMRYGYAYLQATRDALSATTGQKIGSVLVVTHDCQPHGAQILILETAKKLRECGFTIYILALRGGPLQDDFAELGDMLHGEFVDRKKVKEFLLKLSNQGVTVAITSSVVCGSIVPALKEYGFQVLSLIHELPGVIRKMKQENNAALIAQFSDQLVFPAQIVYEKFNEIAPVDSGKIKIRPQGLVRKNPFKAQKNDAHQFICKKHDLDKNTRIVLSIAFMDQRKGPDLFVEMAVEVLKTQPNITFIWVGHTRDEMEQKIIARINELGLSKKIILTGFVRDPLAYYAAASVYALTSREDPFPNVVLESAEVGVPVVAFDGATGAGDFIIEHGGKLAKALDPLDFAQQVCELLSNPISEIKSDVSLKRYALDLMHYLNGFQRVSVVVPNYNYQDYIQERLSGIFGQRYPVYEVIILDDASTDQSVQVINEYLEKTGNEAQLHVNLENAGSVFKQWKKGCDICSGDLVWIAEADDLADEDLLSELTPNFDDDELVLAYCQSNQMGEDGGIIADNYLDYALETSDSFLTDYCRPGYVEIIESMCIKNTIPNVSAVVFRRNTLAATLNEIATELANYIIAGDWLVYLHVLMKGTLSHSKKSLNSHRRHTNSVTNSTQFEQHLQEVINVQKVAFKLVSAPPEKILAAETYISKLCVQFNIPQQKGVHVDKKEIV
jgi:glycosyltransferase involved in cell wall biosynthesis